MGGDAGVGDAEAGDAQVDQVIAPNDSQVQMEDMNTPDETAPDDGVSDATAGEDALVSDAQPSGDGR